MISKHRPRVSIGLPVYNGEKYLSIAIESILGQTFTDFELIICDNASTDRTEEISRYFAEKDARVKYFRNQSNLGAGPNFGKALKLGCGEYFKWAAHDDVLAPTFLERCVAELDSDPTAVLAHGSVDIIDEHGHTIATYDSNLLDAGSHRASTRFGSVVLNDHKCIDVFGLIRRSQLVSTAGHESFPGSDRVLLAELSLQGKFIYLAEPLLQNREHPDRYNCTAMLDNQEAVTWYDPTLAGTRPLRYWSTYLGYFRAIRRQISDRKTRTGCYWTLMRWWFAKRRVKGPLKDLLWYMSPKLFHAVRKMRPRRLRDEYPAFHQPVSDSDQPSASHPPY
jgi:glycosyltransferase involved in cell wall biosynthesis